MPVLMCRNRVADFSKWKTIFDSHAEAHRAAGLRLRGVWREIEDPSNVFFTFDVTDLAQARMFISNPAAADAAKTSGVQDGEYHFLESTSGY